MAYEAFFSILAAAMHGFSILMAVSGVAGMAESVRQREVAIFAAAVLMLFLSLGMWAWAGSMWP